MVERSFAPHAHTSLTGRTYTISKLHAEPTSRLSALLVLRASSASSIPTAITLYRVRIPRVSRLEIIQTLQRALFRKYPPQNPFIEA